MERKRVLIFGAGGRLGAAMARGYGEDLDVVPLGRGEADLAFPQTVADIIYNRRPHAVVNCAAMTNVDACENERELAKTVNARAPEAMAKACTEAGAKFIQISTDYVFNGHDAGGYAEDAVPGPLSWYGETKRQGEAGVLEADPSHAVVRVSWVFGPDRDSFIDKALQTAKRGEPVQAVADKFSSPSYTLDLCEAIRPLLDRSSPGGIFHACNQGICTWRDWAQTALDVAIDSGVALAVREVEPLRLADLKAMAAKRPVHSSMSCHRIESLNGRPLRPWQEAVGDYVRLLVREGRLA